MKKLDMIQDSNAYMIWTKLFFKVNQCSTAARDTWYRWMVSGQQYKKGYQSPACLMSFT